MIRPDFGAALAASLLLAVSLALLPGCGPRHIDATGLSSGSEVVQGVCGQCHELERACSHLGEDYARWHGRIDRMVSWGAPLSAEQRMAAAAHLALLDPGDPSVCSEGGCVPCDAARKKARLGVGIGSGGSSVILGF